MTLEQFTRNEEQVVGQYEYDESSVLAVDFGPVAGDGAVDVVDGTVIVVIGDEQYEFELPDGADDAHTFMKNGILTVELEGDL